MAKRPAYLPNLRYDSISTIDWMNARADRQTLSYRLPAFKNVLNNNFDDADTNLPHECDLNAINPVSIDIQPFRPLEMSIDLASTDFSSSSSSNPPVSSMELITNNFVQMDETSYDLHHIDSIEGECFSKVFKSL